MNEVHMVDEHQCVRCGVVSYVPARGKTGRKFKVMCNNCWETSMKEGKPNETKANEPKK